MIPNPGYQGTRDFNPQMGQQVQRNPNLCFLLNLAADQLAALAIQGMQPTWKEKLLGQEFVNLGQLAQRVAALNSKF